MDSSTGGWLDRVGGPAGPVRPGPGGPQPTCKLYRNNGDGTFTDVTEQAGLACAGFGQGVAVGDFDNDGYDDLVVTFLGKIVLYHNNGNGTFTDVTAKAGLRNPHWGPSLPRGDIAHDGYLDLYLFNYVESDLQHH